MRKVLRCLVVYVLLKIMSLVRPITCRKFPDGPKKILVISFNALGDFLLSTSVFKAIYNQYPAASIDLLCSHRNYELAQAYDYFDKITPIDLNKTLFNIQAWKTIWQLRQQNYDLVLNLYYEPDDSAVFKICFLTHNNPIYSLQLHTQNLYKGLIIPQTHLFFEFATNLPSLAPHFIDRLFDITLFWQSEKNIDYTYYPPMIRSKPNTSHHIYERNANLPNILFNPIGSQSNNTLAKDTAHHLFKVLSQHGKVFCFELARSYFEHNNPQYIKTASILDAAEAIQGMDIVVTTETAISHLCIALNKPVLILRANEKHREAFDPKQGDFSVLVSKARDINTLELSEFKLELNAMLTVLPINTLR